MAKSTNYTEMNFEEADTDVDDNPSFGKFKKSTPKGKINCPKESEDYPINKNGICYIFNHEEFDVKNLKNRSGTEVDAKLLQTFFQALGFEVKRFDDLKCMEVLDTAYTASCEKKNNKMYSCFICCILTYEAEPGFLYARDGSYPVKRIFERFYGNNCVELAGKPKIFFIQACQSVFNSSDSKSSKQTTDSGHKESFKIHTLADFLVVFSSMPGFYSWDNSTKGSWFIEALYHTLSIHGGSMELLELLKIVTRRVLYDCQNSEYKYLENQVPCVTSTLTRNFKFPIINSSVEAKFKNLELGHSYRSEDYCMDSTKIVKVYIFNHIKFEKGSKIRHGTNEDLKNLEETFKNLNFDVKIFHDAKCEEISNEIIKVASNSHEEFSCFICCILTHGNDGNLTAKDGQYDINKIFTPFHNKWVGKPKIYFLQACRGKLVNSGVKVRCLESVDSGDNPAEYIFVPFMHPDFLIAYATTAGNAALRNPANGSWFIRELCHALQNHAKVMNLSQLLTIVHRVVAIHYISNSEKKEYKGKKQVPCLVSTLTKNVRFNVNTEL